MLLISIWYLKYKFIYIAIRLLHKHRILHRDLKPANLFLSHEDLDRAQLNIADFDHSTKMEDDVETCN